MKIEVTSYVYLWSLECGCAGSVPAGVEGGRAWAWVRGAAGVWAGVRPRGAQFVRVRCGRVGSWRHLAGVGVGGVERVSGWRGGAGLPLGPVGVSGWGHCIKLTTITT